MDPSQPTPPNQNPGKNISDSAKELEHITKEMYKKNLELNERNKTLALLRKIDEIILSSVTDTKEIAQQVTNLLASEAGFKVAVILIFDQDNKVLTRIALSQSEAVAKAEQISGKTFHGMQTPLTEEQNLVVQAVKEKTTKATHRLYDVLLPDYSLEQAQKIQDATNIKSSLIYPLVVRDEVIGAMIISIAEDENNLSEYQQDLLVRLSAVVGIAIDNSLLYKELQDANEKLKALDKLKDEFLSLASHELRTPMTAIKGYIWMLLNKGDGLDAEKKKTYIERAFNSTVRLIDLVNDMLNVSRIESGRINISPKQFSIIELTKEIAEELSVRATERSIALTVTPETVLQVFADSDKIREVITNLIGNALKFTQPQDKITITFTQEGDFVTTHVTDTGRGMSEEDMKKLFTKFGRLENSLSSVAEVEGTGLGLYLCKQYVELSGGKITVTSKLGEESTFSFSLPTKPAATTSAQQEKPVDGALQAVVAAQTQATP